MAGRLKGFAFVAGRLKGSAFADDHLGVLTVLLGRLKDSAFSVAPCFRDLSVPCCPRTLCSLCPRTPCSLCPWTLCSLWPLSVSPVSQPLCHLSCVISLPSVFSLGVPLVQCQIIVCLCVSQFPNRVQFCLLVREFWSVVLFLVFLCFVSQFSVGFLDSWFE